MSNSILLHNNYYNITNSSYIIQNIKLSPKPYRVPEIFYFLKNSMLQMSEYRLTSINN